MLSTWQNHRREEPPGNRWGFSCLCWGEIYPWFPAWVPELCKWDRGLGSTLHSPFSDFWLGLKAEALWQNNPFLPYVAFVIFIFCIFLLQQLKNKLFLHPCLLLLPSFHFSFFLSEFLYFLDKTLQAHLIFSLPSPWNKPLLQWALGLMASTWVVFRHQVLWEWAHCYPDVTTSRPDHWTVEKGTHVNQPLLTPSCVCMCMHACVYRCVWF